MTELRPTTTDAQQAQPYHVLRTPPASDVRGLDPLRLDEFYGGKPLARRSLPSVMAALHKATRLACGIRALNGATALAILRDLDPLVCAVEARTPGAWQRVDGLEEVLMKCGRVADHIPRGDNATYGLFNPPPPRTRTFTHTPEEHALFRGLAMGESRLDELLGRLAVCLTRRLDDPVHADAAESLAEQWEPMVDAAKLMRRAHVAPVMGAQIAPWVSHTISIGGRGYRGPTAAQLPVVMVDWMIWGIDRVDPIYRDYHRYYAAEQPLPRRRLVEHALRDASGRSLLSRLAEDLPQVADRTVAQRSLDGIDTLLRRMYGFRSAHAVFAKTSLPVRGDGDQSWGTGEFDPEMLDRLLRYTGAARHRLAALRDHWS